MIRASDYERLFDDFLRVMVDLGDDVLSVMVYGSLAKGTLRPGLSDLLDVVAVFRPELLDNSSNYCRALDQIIEMCIRISNEGVPFHPLQYFFLEEGQWSTLAFYLPAWKSEKFSTIVIGSDLRGALATADQKLDFMRGWYFGFYRQFQRRAVVMMDNLHNINARNELIPMLLDFVRHVPQRACLACNCLVDRAEATERFIELFPVVDVSAIRDVLAIADDRSAALDCELAASLVRRSLRLNEAIYRSVNSWIRDHGRYLELKDVESARDRSQGG